MNKAAVLLVSWLLPAAQAAPVRMARLGEFEGKVEVQLHAGDEWRPAARNLPLVERSWIRAAPSARVEVELDDGSALRLAGDAICELSDYTRLSTGQRVTLISLDHGIAYVTGQPDRRDALILVVPGAQATLRTRARLRLDAGENDSRIAVLEGAARFSSPVAELDLAENQTARVESSNRARFFLYREVTPLDSDKWSLERDRILASTGSAGHVPGVTYGLMDLDTSGSWIQTGDFGAVWKPKAAPGWVPYRDGEWLWYDEVGFTWIANESWGWLPFHYGRWMEQRGLGWVWVPGKSAVFKPGDVYWLKEAGVVGWGPLAPGDNYDARAVPQQYVRSNTTLAKWQADTHELIPDAAGRLRTTEAVFVIAPPSPALDAARLDAARPVLRAGSTRIVPILPGVTYAPADAPAELTQEVATAPAGVPAPPMPPQPLLPADAAIPPQPGFAPSQVYVPVAVPEPVEVYYPAPVYTGIIVVNPPEQPDKTGKSSPGLGMPRGDNRGHRPAPAPEPPPAAAPPVHSPEPHSHPSTSPPPSQPHEAPHDSGGSAHSDTGAGKHSP